MRGGRRREFEPSGTPASGILRGSFRGVSGGWTATIATATTDDKPTGFARRGKALSSTALSGAAADDDKMLYDED